MNRLLRRCNRMSHRHGRRRGVAVAIAAAVLLVAGAVAVGGAAAQQDGEFEPNDDLANATAIEPGTYANLTITEGDLDVYAVELRGGRRADGVHRVLQRRGRPRLRPVVARR
ncbi:hypothetical protein ACFQRB_07485 [Halobaculum litoreum]|uniref:Uncharacterized protein n=1 Tax=Halobaculum litoreum TaxID=3031998 RepID=A0ABD5XTN0_9EURY